MLLGFLIMIVVAGLSGMLLFLNQERVAFVLTPAFRGVFSWVDGKVPVCFAKRKGRVPQALQR